MSNKKLTGTLIPKNNKKAKMPATFYSDKPIGGGGGGGTSDYSDLYNKPSIEGVTLNGNKTASELGLAKSSDLNNFVTKSVNDLTNYYLKSETYTKAEVAALIGAIQQFHYEIYPTLPQSGQGNVLYLIGPTGSGADRYEEYVYSNNAFTKIGDTSIDLSGYVTTSALNTALASYATTQDLEDSKVFWAEVDVTTFAEIQAAIDDGRTVMLKDEDDWVYVLSYIYDDMACFVCANMEHNFIKHYNVYGDDQYELFAIYDIESQFNKVNSISSSSDNDHYPSAYAVYQALQSYTPTSQLSAVATSGSYNDLINKPTIPTVPTNVSAFNNDAGYLTQHQSLSGYAKYVLCADEAAYNAISPKQSDTLYLIPES